MRGGHICHCTMEACLRWRTSVTGRRSSRRMSVRSRGIQAFRSGSAPGDRAVDGRWTVTGLHCQRAGPSRCSRRRIGLPALGLGVPPRSWSRFQPQPLAASLPNGLVAVDLPSRGRKSSTSIAGSAPRPALTLSRNRYHQAWIRRPSRGVAGGRRRAPVGDLRLPAQDLKSVLPGFRRRQVDWGDLCRCTKASGREARRRDAAYFTELNHPPAGSASTTSPPPTASTCTAVTSVKKQRVAAHQPPRAPSWARSIASAEPGRLPREYTAKRPPTCQRPSSLQRVDASTHFQRRGFLSLSRKACGASSIALADRPSAASTGRWLSAISTNSLARAYPVFHVLLAGTAWASRCSPPRSRQGAIDALAVRTSNAIALDRERSARRVTLPPARPETHHHATRPVRQLTRPPLLARRRPPPVRSARRLRCSRDPIPQPGSTLQSAVSSWSAIRSRSRVRHS